MFPKVSIPKEEDKQLVVLMQDGGDECCMGTIQSSPGLNPHYSIPVEIYGYVPDNWGAKVFLNGPHNFP